MGLRGPKPGTARKGGRQKGTANKTTRDMKSMIEGALKAMGGQKYLEKIADTHPQTFAMLCAKLVPTTLAGDADNPLIPSKIQQVIVDPKS